MNERVTYQTLDGMRGIAAICVVLLHATSFGTPLTPSAYLAPDLFFVLSGFVIAHAYDRRIEGGLTALLFLKIRLVRFYPLYLLGLTIGGAVALWTMSPTVVAVAYVVMLFFAPFPMRSPEGALLLFPLNAPAWTLFYELIINIGYAIAFRQLTNRRLVILIAILGVGLVGIGVLRGTISGGWIANVGQIAIAMLRVSFSFCVGLMIYRLRDRLPHFAVPPLLLLGIVGLVMTLKPSGVGVLALDLVAVFFLFPALVIAGIQAQPSEFFAPIFRLLGLTSYGIYAIHQPILHGLEMIWPSGSRFAEVIVVSSLIGVVYAADRWLDAPIRRALSNRLTRRNHSGGRFPR